jgi:heat shock protein HslJ
MQPPPLRKALAVFLAILGVMPVAAQAPGAELENTYWKLIELSGKPANAVHEPHEPHIVLRAAEKPGDKSALRGSGSCNRLVGSYRLEGDAIEIGPIASTRMTCANGMAQEQALFAALAAARSWALRGRELELRDVDGRALARFEARAQK